MAAGLGSLPFGPGHVVHQWPYLGVTVAAPSFAALPAPGTWTAAGLLAIQHGTWLRAMDKADDRARTVTTAGGSAGLRAALWNSPHLIASPISVPGLLA